MTRRNFVKTIGGAGAVALAAPKSSLFAAEEDKPLRVALIGCGWYGKTDLFHLIQVAPVSGEPLWGRISEGVLPKM